MGPARELHVRVHLGSRDLEDVSTFLRVLFLLSFNNSDSQQVLWREEGGINGS